MSDLPARAPDPNNSKYPVTADRVKALTEVAIGGIERDMKVRSSTEAYSIWMLGIASAGLALCITQSEPVIRSNLIVEVFPIWATKLLVVLAAIMFGAGAMMCAVLKGHIHGEMKMKLRRITFLKFQPCRVDAGECAPLPSFVSGDLYDAIRMGGFLEQESRELLNEASKKEAQFADGTHFFFYNQMYATAIGAALLSLAAAF